ncbi:hypothetical protein BJ875DRAFT_499391 [Amylocarpus encephaloides]|uniref:Uncharacterized protein n=1 Tax=Amylocarpus encephaloides TaxID=45428 RepID=A0A9P7YAI5_9HELO|nr:hypothetical protein BJ875DRAFT_499391 [Amylocarpus encephaloides]
MAASTYKQLSPTLLSDHRSSSATLPTGSPFREAQVHFTQSQLALALTISKNRPEEYCQQLRKRIKTGQNSVNEEARYVDGAEFWRDQYEVVHREKKALQDKVDRLEEEARLWRDAEEDGVDVNAEGFGLRELLSRSIEPPQTVSEKRKRTQEKEEQFLLHLNSQPTHDSLADDHFLRLSSYVLRLGRQRTNLQKITRLANDLDYLEDIMQHLAKLLSLIHSAMVDCCSPLCTTTANQADSHVIKVLEQSMAQIALSYDTCFTALNEICQTMVGRTKKDLIIHKMIGTIGTGMDLLQTFSTIQGETSYEERAFRNQRSQSHVPKQEFIANKYLAGALSTIVSQLDWEVNKPGHSELLEGILFKVLEHTGRLVSMATFREHVATSEKPGHISIGLASTEIDAVTYESRHIVQILYAALGGLEKQKLVSRVLAAGRSTTSTLTKADNANMLVVAKRLIQSTLMKSVFGGVNFETLRLPRGSLHENESPVSALSGAATYGSEWLVENVLTLVGWDQVL